MSYLSDETRDLVLRNKVILIVEDDVFLSKIYDRTLRALGAGVVLTVDGEDALRELNGHVPDVIVLDILMPRMNGYDFLRKIREEPRLRSVPVIALTNLDAEPGQELEMADLGIREYLVKANTSIEDLVKKVIHYAGAEK